MTNPTTAPIDVVLSSRLVCIPLVSQDVFWVTMPDGAQLCLRKTWVPGLSTAMGQWLWAVSAQIYPQAQPNLVL